MSPRRRGVATYLQTFLLIGVALGGSVIVFDSLRAYTSVAPSPTLSISTASMKEGAGTVLETLTIANAGTAPFPSVSVLNRGLSSAAEYCYTIWSAVGQGLIGSTCPSMSTDPTTIQLPWPLAPGASEVVQVTIVGDTSVHVGQSLTVVVTTPQSAQGSVALSVVPA